MKRIFTVLLSAVLILMLTFNSSAEIIVDYNIKDFLSNYFWNSVTGGAENAVSGTPSAKNQYVNVANGSLAFYVSDSGKANIIYTLALKESYKKSATIAIYIEKHLWGPFWQRLNTEWSATFSDKYHADNLSCNLQDEGDYRAVMFVSAGIDSFKLVSEFEYKKGYLLGDVNKDGKINAADARLVLRYAARLEKDSVNIKTRGDMNGDGKVNATDARLILKITQMK